MSDDLHGVRVLTKFESFEDYIEGADDTFFLRPKFKKKKTKKKIQKITLKQRSMKNMTINYWQKITTTSNIKTVWNREKKP